MVKWTCGKAVFVPNSPETTKGFLIARVCDMISFFRNHVLIVYRFSSDQSPRSLSSSLESCKSMDISTNSRLLTMLDPERLLLSSMEDLTSAVSSHQDSTSSWRTSRSSSMVFSHPDNSDSSFSPPTRVSWTMLRQDKTIPVVRSSASSIDQPS